MPESVTFVGRSAASPAMGPAYGGRPAGPNVRSMGPPSSPPPTLTLPSPCLIVLVGPAASGKSTWAAEWFPTHQVVSSDALRALVGEGEHDLSASKDAFALLDTVVQQRLRRRVTTVVDTLALDAAQRARYRALAEQAGVPCFAIAFDVPAAEIRARNRARGTTVPTAVVSAQLKGWPAVRDALAAEGFAAVHPPGPVA